MLYDAFICHASEDKEAFVRPLADRLSAYHLHIWYDEFTLEIGDSLRQAIDQGLSKSRFGIVVLSPSFFQKGWPQRELDGLVARQVAEKRRLILPIWHNITEKEILTYSPPLADTVAIKSDSGMTVVCRALLRKLRPAESPLIAARDELIPRGIDPPVISDEWWLDIVEASNRIPGYGFYVPEQAVWGRWTFPLPHSGAVGAERGVNLAWTAMQLEWSRYAEEAKICQITHPDMVHKFIQVFPGLSEICQTYASHLACYAPQLTIPEFSGPFAEEFEAMLSKSERDRTEERSRGSRSGAGLTVDGEAPLCDREIALRHPTFGNYQPDPVASFYVHSEMGAPTSRCFDDFDYVVWILSQDSQWLPRRHREYLLRGLRDHAGWAVLTSRKAIDTFVGSLPRSKGRKVFRMTKTIRSKLSDAVSDSLEILEINESVVHIVDQFIGNRFIEGYFEPEGGRRKRRSS